MKISCIVHTRNSGETLGRTLASAAWVNELIVVDMESTDDTMMIAKQFNAVIFHHPVVPRVDGIRNIFIEKASHDWVLVLDSDEYLSDDAAEIMMQLIEQYQMKIDAFSIPRFNTIAGQVMKGSNWYPDHQIRLFKKGCVRWGDTTHRLPDVLTGPHRLLELCPPDCLHIHHANYKDIRSFVQRQVDYALNDSYDPAPGKYDFSDYIAMAYERLALHHDPENDGDLSHALSLLMAWDAVVRGILHWEKLNPRPPLSYLKALPMTQQKVPRWRILLRKLGFRHFAVAYVARRLLAMGKGLIRLKP
ncbi:MAG: glycosyltransferase family 2 protein [Pseudomonadota bacterium]